MTLDQLESHLWEAANILRGPVDAADFKTYVFPLLFFKRIADVHDEECRARPEHTARSYQYRVALADCFASTCLRWPSIKRIEMPCSTHAARPCLINRSARFREVKRWSEAGLRMRMSLRTTVAYALELGLRVYPQRDQRYCYRRCRPQCRREQNRLQALYLLWNQ